MDTNVPQQAGFAGYVPILKTRDLPGQLWQLQKPLRFYSVLFKRWFETPEGFITDGNSTPSIIFWLANKAQEACYMHDWHYTSRFLNRLEADQLLREAVISMGYSLDDAEEMFLGVRAFGFKHWNLPNVPQPEYIQVLIDGK